MHRLRAILLTAILFCLTASLFAAAEPAILTRSVESQPFTFSFVILTDPGDTIPIESLVIEVDGQPWLDGPTLVEAISRGYASAEVFNDTGTIRVDMPGITLGTGSRRMAVGFAGGARTEVSYIVWTDQRPGAMTASEATDVLRAYVGWAMTAKMQTLSAASDGFSKSLFDDNLALTSDTVIALQHLREQLAASETSVAEALGVLAAKAEETTARGAPPRKGGLRSLQNAGFYLWGKISSSAGKSKDEIVSTLERMSPSDRQKAFDEYVEAASIKQKNFYVLKSNGDKYTNVDEYLTDLKAGNLTGKANFQVVNWKESEVFGTYADNPHMSKNLAETGGELCEKGGKVYVAAVKAAGGPLGAVAEVAEKTVEYSEKADKLINDPVGTLKEETLNAAKSKLKGKVLDIVSEKTGVDSDTLEQWADNAADTYEKGRALSEFVQGGAPEGKGGVKLTGDGAEKVDVSLVVGTDESGEVKVGVIDNEGGGTPPTAVVGDGSADVVSVQEGGGVDESDGVTVTEGEVVEVEVEDKSAELSISASDVTVASGEAFNLTAEASGGTPPYEYAWTSGGAIIASGATLSIPKGHLEEPGEYGAQAVVKDAAGETATASVTITVEEVPAEATLTITSPASGTETADVAQLVTGTVQGAEAVDILGLLVNGNLQEMAVASTFSQNVALIPGENTIQAGALLKDGTLVYSNAVTITSTQSSDNQYHIRLVWNTNDTDVDLHLVAPDGTDCYYGNQNPGFGAVLDFDDTDGYGPENITVSQLTQRGTYTVAVHYYSDHNYEGDTPSTATVQVFRMGQLILTDSRTLHDGDYWTVFTFTY